MTSVISTSGKMLSIFILFISVLSCTEPVVPITPVEPTPRDTIWQQKHKIHLGNPNGVIGTDYKVIYKNLYITDDDHDLPGVNILAYDMLTGKLAWEWRYDKLEFDHSYKLEVNGDNLIIDTRYGLINFNLLNQSINWQVLYRDLNYTYSGIMHIQDNFIYTALRRGSSNQINSNTYVRWQISNGRRE